MTTYVFDRAAGERPRADPQQIGEALERIRLDNGGELHPRGVVEGARSPTSPLHRHFEWNDRKAAEAHRVDQARALIRSIRVIDEKDQPRPAFLSIRADDGIGYRSYSDVISSVDLRQRLLEQAERDLNAWTLRYNELKEIVSLIEPARRELRRRVKPRGEDEASP
jgi:hypothetical protein